MSRTGALQISPDTSGNLLTPQQKRFNTLLRQIGKERQKLAAWHEHAPAFRQAYTQVLQPLRDELMAGLRQWVFALAELLERQKWTKGDRETLRELLCDAATPLLWDSDDAELKALYDRHAEFESPQEVVRKMVDALRDQQREAQASQQVPDERAAAEEAERTERAAHHRKTAAQQRREADEQKAAQSLRETYRKLASALHPDREPDPKLRAEKTALMQRVNQAYDASDLLALLELQLKIEQIDENHMANASTDRLKQYNRVLSGQLAELKEEVERVEMEFRWDLSLAPHTPLNPRKLGELIERTHRQWSAERTEQERLLGVLANVAATKRWLKQQRQRFRDQWDYEDELF